MHLSIWLLAICSVVCAEAFYPVPRPTVVPVAGRSLVVKRVAHPVDESLHPELRRVDAVNRVSRRYRKRGFAGPDIDSEEALQDARDSLQRRGLLEQHEKKRRQATNIVIQTDLSSNSPTTVDSVLPAVTPKTPDSIGVDQDGADYSYFITVRFGTEGKKFVLVVDTGSSDTWIPSSDCTSKSCLKQATYGAADSGTLSTTTDKFDIKYGSGDIVGTTAKDTLSFAGFTFSASFGLASEVSDEFVNFEMDGIMGMGFANGSQQGIATIVDELVEQGQMKDKVVGIALSRATDGRNDGVINFGGLDVTQYDGELKFIDSVSQDGLWELPMDGAGVNGSALDVPGRTAVIDTGTSLILLPPNDALRLHSKIPGSETNGELYSLPCNNSLPLDIVFGGVTYQIPAQDYVGDLVDVERDMCLSLITGRQVLESSMWLLGAVFIKNIYAVLDYDNKCLGLGKKKQPSDTLEVVRQPTAVINNYVGMSMTAVPSSVTSWFPTGSAGSGDESGGDGDEEGVAAAAAAARTGWVVVVAVGVGLGVGIVRV